MHTKITCTRPATNRPPQSSVIGGGGAYRLFPLPADGITGHWWTLRGGPTFCSVTGTHVRLQKTLPIPGPHSGPCSSQRDISEAERHECGKRSVGEGAVHSGKRGWGGLG